MPRLAGILLIIVLTAPVISGCGVAECEFDPIPSFEPTIVPAAFVTPNGDTANGPDQGACPQYVVFDDTEYGDRWSYPSTNWTLTEADLTPIGRATAASRNGPTFLDDAVYAIDGVDPSDAIAMHIWSGDIYLLFDAQSDFPESMCRFLRTKPRGCERPLLSQPRSAAAIRCAASSGLRSEVSTSKS